MKFFILIALLLSLYSCSELLFGKDDTLTMTRTDYTSNQLKIDGYYYLKDSASYQRVSLATFFYRNGVLQDIGGASESLEKYDAYISSIVGDFKGEKKGIVGVFIIQDKNISFEKLELTQPYKAYTYTGTIINDTTFHITESYRMLHGKKTEITSENSTYYYHKFSPKPDSTNLYVK
jgi:hypothetical protein